MDYQNILVDFEDRIGIIKLNRPEVRNALDSKTLAEISLAIEALENNESIGVIVITGAGKSLLLLGRILAN